MRGGGLRHISPPTCDSAGPRRFGAASGGTGTRESEAEQRSPSFSAPPAAPARWEVGSARGCSTKPKKRVLSRGLGQNSSEA